jgi:hypothetical protein
MISLVKHLRAPWFRNLPTWADYAHWYRSLRSICLVSVSFKVGLEAIVHKALRTSRYGKRTMIISHMASRTIQGVSELPQLPILITLPPDHQVIHRYQFVPDMPMLTPSVTGRITDFSPLGDQIWGVATRHLMTFRFAYEQLKQCVQKRRCPRDFWWHNVHLRLWRITLVELRMLLELLQGKHLDIYSLKIQVEFKDPGTLSTRDFMMAGPTLWRLLGKFIVVSLDFRHELTSLPKPGNGPKGLWAFSASERLNLKQFMASGLLPTHEPVDRWKYTFENVFGPFLSAIMAESCVVYTNAQHDKLESNHVDRFQLYRDVDLEPIAEACCAAFKSPSMIDWIWEWEHGSVAPKKTRAPEWSKITVKAKAADL